MVRKLVVITRMIMMAVMCLAFTACSLGMDNTLDRTTSDPYAEIPKVQSFNGDNSILIRWDRDEAADEYYLYRAEDNLNPQYQVVYKGLFIEFRDNFALSFANKPFIYRLGKRRGNKLFVDLNTPSKTNLGIVLGSEQDIHEPNNTKENATHLNDITLEANGWYYSSNTIDDVSIFDEDWYSVDIPAHWKASIILRDLDASGSPTLNHFKIEKRGIGSENIITNTPNFITNTGNYPARFYFRIYPNYETFKSLYTDPGPPLGSGTGGCGKFIRYTIELSALVPN